MVRYELRAQHRPPATGGDVQVWHIVPRGRAVTLCHKPLDVVGMPARSRTFASCRC